MIRYQLMETNLSRRPTTLSVHYGDHVRSRVDDDKGISRLISQLFENTFVKVAICQSISPALSSKGQRVSTDLDKYLAKHKLTCVGRPPGFGNKVRNHQGQLEAW